MMLSNLWYEESENPGRLSAEMEAFKTAGMNPQLIIAEGDALHIKITLSVFGKQREGKVIYPDFYPYFRPELIIRDLPAKRHYNPFGGIVCLLKRGTENWEPELMAAELIQQQLPNWERASILDYEEERIEGEDHQAEPIEEYISSPDNRIYIDVNWPPTEYGTHGKLQWRERIHRGNLNSNHPLAGWVTYLESEDGHSYVEFSPALDNWCKTQKISKELSGIWVSVNAFTQDLLAKPMAYLKEHHYEAEKRLLQILKRSGKVILGINFPQESTSELGNKGWIFFIVSSPKHKRPKKGNAPLNLQPYRAEYFSKEEYFTRIPELKPIQSKKIAVVGLGCIGAPSALSFAQSGVGEIRLMDGDYVSAGTTCRWPLGMKAAQKQKTAALKEFIGEAFPLTIVQEFRANGIERSKIGVASGTKQNVLLYNFLDGVDMIYDATAEVGVNHLLSDIARQLSIPYVTVSSRPGGIGGTVLRVRPDAEGCYVCFQYALSDPSNEYGIPPPPYDPDGEELQPVGCGDLTFTAAGFDVQTVALAGVRMAISTLCEGATGYPEIEHDIGVLSLRKDNGSSLFPEWKAYMLKRHPECRNCSARDS